MATSVGSIKVDASLDSAKFAKGLKGMQESAAEQSKKIQDSLKSIVSTAGKVGAASGAALVAGAVKGFGEYEQLIGGVEKLFGSAADSVTENAESAFSRMQISANDYMNTVTGFSASLISGLNGDTAKAAKIADTAIMDMADNANTFGTSMSMIQYTYQGFAKQNYTMLDNLKLGYGGTQSEMARLINDSGVLGDTMEVTAETVNSVSFDKIIEAIHTVQERMNITGTSSKEATKTVEGSFNQMKAAAQNFLTALGGGGDADKAFQQLASSAKTFLDNLVPVIQSFVDNVVGIIASIWDDFKENHPVVAGAITAIGTLLGTLLIPKLVVVVAQTALAGVGALVAGAKMLAGWMMALGPIGLIVAAIAGVVAAVVALWNNFEGFRDFVKGAVKAIAKFFSDLWDGIKSGAKAVWDFLKGVFDAIAGAVMSAVTAIKNVVVGAYNWLMNTIITPIWQFIQNVGILIIALITNLITGIYNIVAPIVQWIWNTILLPIINAYMTAMRTISNAVKTVVDTVMTVVGVIVGWINDNIIQPVAGFFTGLWDGIKNGVSSAVDTIKSAFESVKNWINNYIIGPVANFFSGLWNGIKGGVDALGGGIQSGMNAIAGFIKAPINAIIGAINGVIDTINGIKVPDWVPGIGGSHTNFGHIPTLATGGYVNGYGTSTSDSNMAMLSRGEYVVKADTVRKFGVGFMDALNDGRLMQTGATSNVQNYYYQFDQQANNRWMYQQVKTGAAA